MRGTATQVGRKEGRSVALAMVGTTLSACFLTACFMTADESLWQQDATGDRPAVDRSGSEMSPDAVVEKDAAPDSPVTDTHPGETAVPDTALDAVPDTAPDTAPDTTPPDLGAPDMSCKQMVLQVTSDADDGEVDDYSFMPNGESGTVLMGYWGTSATWGYFRFKLGQALPAKAVVSAATLELWGYDAQGWDPTTYALGIWAEDAADAPWVGKKEDAPFLPGGRPVTGASVRWPVTGGLYWKLSQYNLSPDLKPLLQEVINKHGGLAQNANVQLWIRGAQTDQGEVGTHDFLQGNYAAHPHRLTLSWCE